MHNSCQFAALLRWLHSRVHNSCYPWIPYHDSWLRGPVENHPFFCRHPWWLLSAQINLNYYQYYILKLWLKKNHGFLGYGGRKVDFFESTSGDSKLSDMYPNIAYVPAGRVFMVPIGYINYRARVFYSQNRAVPLLHTQSTLQKDFGNDEHQKGKH